MKTGQLAPIFDEREMTLDELIAPPSVTASSSRASAH